MSQSEVSSCLRVQLLGQCLCIPLSDCWSLNLPLLLNRSKVPLAVPKTTFKDVSGLGSNRKKSKQTLCLQGAQPDPAFFIGAPCLHQYADPSVLLRYLHGTDREWGNTFINRITSSFPFLLSPLSCNTCWWRYFTMRAPSATLPSSLFSCYQALPTLHCKRSKEARGEEQGCRSKNIRQWVLGFKIPFITWLSRTGTRNDGSEIAVLAHQF